MIPVTDLRAGVVFEENDGIFEVLSYEHIKMGRGSATVKVRIKNLKTGSTVDKSFISNAQVKDVNLEKKELQFLYADEKSAYFMDQGTFEQVMLSLDVLEGWRFLKEGELATIKFYKDTPLGLVLLPKVNLKVVDTPPGVKGNSASNVYKDAVLENGLKTKVPLFVNIGDAVVVDTRDGSYTKRI